MVGRDGWKIWHLDLEVLRKELWLFAFLVLEVYLLEDSDP